MVTMKISFFLLPSDENDSCPWQGSLRHVSGPIGHSLAFTPQPHPQFKRYPDEDAPNPFASMRGSNTRAAIPITPSALINGCTVDYNSWKKEEEEEQLTRIRSNIKEKRTMSNALLKVLMP